MLNSIEEYVPGLFCPNGVFIPGFRTGRRIKALYFPFIGFFLAFISFFVMLFIHVTALALSFKFIFYSTVRVSVLILSINSLYFYLLFV